MIKGCERAALGWWGEQPLSDAVTHGPPNTQTPPCLTSAFSTACSGKGTGDSFSPMLYLPSKGACH